MARARVGRDDPPLTKSSQSLLSATTSRQAPLDFGQAQSTRNLASLRGGFTGPDGKEHRRSTIDGRQFQVLERAPERAIVEPRIRRQGKVLDPGM